MSPSIAPHLDEHLFKPLDNSLPLLLLVFKQVKSTFRALPLVLTTRPTGRVCIPEVPLLLLCRTLYGLSSTGTRAARILHNPAVPTLVPIHHQKQMMGMHTPHLQDIIMGKMVER